MIRRLPIERIPPPSVEVFRREYLEPGRPVIITGLIDDWPARKRWSWEYFDERFGDRRLTSVPLEHGKAAYGNGRRGVPYDSVLLREYLSVIRTAGAADRAVVFPVEQ